MHHPRLRCFRGLAVLADHNPYHYRPKSCRWSFRHRFLPQNQNVYFQAQLIRLCLFDKKRELEFESIGEFESVVLSDERKKPTIFFWMLLFVVSAVNHFSGDFERLILFVSQVGAQMIACAAVFLQSSNWILQMW